ncbi:MAG TPA: aminopeptidase P N-terminal domain-containing protein [Methylophilus sp.]|uniref:aminopeptidase P N-terminal domain-containing protein n=1 Tax=Methylophilus sp. TaxID=29541 RepID=UPI002CE94B40|nr:aminopeptidase P N-terminal domain-containing protein [Methylophilus sp.]HSH86535.1 aminopeptidase P N-terminal domain-containing protein [Methylophilus sp.]
MREFSLQEFTRRRQQLMSTMQAGIAVIPTAPEVTRNRDSHYPFRFDSYFYYLTGFKEPEAVLVLIAGAENKSILFCRDKDIEREIWDGFRHGPEAAKTEFGFDEAYSITQLDEVLPTLLANQPALFYRLGTDAGWDTKVTGWLNAVRAQTRTGIQAPAKVVDVRQYIDALRLVKSPWEIDLMRRSAEIAASAHNRAMQMVKPGKWEYEVEAEFLHEFYRQGAQAPAYTSIVAGGANACTLHYNANNAELKGNDLLLIDAGCELEGYASDITRTFPVNGRFSGPQKDLYELVLAAQAAAIASVSPQHHWNAPHEAALDVLVDGFIHYGLCHGSHDEVLENGSYRQFYMHRTGHWLGLDVHDAGEYKTPGGDWVMLQPGNVLTVEPGCYVRPADNVPAHFWNIGIRIEDDVLVTENSYEVLTSAAVKSISDIENLMHDSDKMTRKQLV